MRVLFRRLVTFAFVGYLAYALVWHPTSTLETFTGWPADRLEEAAAETISLRIFAKTDIAHDVVAGRRSLFEAAALFRELNRLPPTITARSWSDGFGRPYVADTEEEGLCRQVIMWVGSTIERIENPVQSDAAETLLNDVLRAEMQNQARIRLPDPAALEPAGELLEHCRGALADARRGRQGS